MSILISPSLASLLFGVSEKSIRRAIKNKEITTTVLNGRYKIDFAKLILWSEKLPNRKKKRDENGIGQYIKEWKI